MTGGLAGGLTEEERLLQATAREFATRELAPTAIERDEEERYDRSLFAQDGRARPDRGATSRIGRWGRLLLPRLDPGHGGARRGRHVDGGLALGPHPVAVPGRDLGDARAARPLAATDAHRRGARRLRPHRAARGQRRRRDPNARRARGPGRRADRLSIDRDEDLDLQRPRGGPLPGLRDARSGGRREGDHRVPGREGDARFPVRGARAEDGDPGVPGRGARVRRRRGPGRRTGSARRARATRSRCPRSARAGSRSRRPASGSRGPGWRRRLAISGSGRRSGHRSPSSRACGSCWPRWPARSRPRGP